MLVNVEIGKIRNKDLGDVLLKSRANFCGLSIIKCETKDLNHIHVPWTNGLSSSIVAFTYVSHFCTA